MPARSLIDPSAIVIGNSEYGAPLISFSLTVTCLPSCYKIIKPIDTAALTTNMITILLKLSVTDYPYVNNAYTLQVTCIQKLFR